MSDVTEKDLVWLPKDLAKLVKDAAGIEGYEQEILSYVRESKLDMKESIEEIDKAIVLYRAKMIAARNSFREAKEAELDANYTLWETYSADIKTTRAYISTAKAVVESLKTEVSLLNKAIEGLDINRVERFLKSLTTLKDFTDKEKTVTSIILNLKGDS
jgi:hypothetical protein